jgi:hypothetical protein
LEQRAIFMEASDALTDKIRHEAVPEADELACCISLCNSSVGDTKESKDGIDGSGGIVGLGNGVEEVVVVSMIKDCKVWSSFVSWGWETGDGCLVDN